MITACVVIWISLGVLMCESQRRAVKLTGWDVIVLMTVGPIYTIIAMYVALAMLLPNKKRPQDRKNIT